MRITSRGRVTIPAEIREEAGLLPGAEVEFRLDGQMITIVKTKSPEKPSRGARLIAQMRGKDDFAMTTDVIMAITRH